HTVRDLSLHDALPIFTGLVYRDRVGGDSHRIELEGAFVQIGLLPNTEWLKGIVALSPRGETEGDHAGRTSLPGGFAAGDATTTRSEEHTSELQSRENP